MKRIVATIIFVQMTICLYSCTPSLKYRMKYREQFSSRYDSERYNQDDAYVYKGAGNRHSHNRDMKSQRAGIIDTAKRYLGVNYRYGGITPRGFDCSGLTMYVYRKNGIPLSRSAKKQYHSGTRIGLRRVMPGDLVFFQTSRKERISHVGIYVGNNTFIHAPRPGKKVQYAKINRYWQKRFIGAVSYL